MIVNNMNYLKLLKLSVVSEESLLLSVFLFKFKLPLIHILHFLHLMQIFVLFPLRRIAFWHFLSSGFSHRRFQTDLLMARSGG